MSTEEKVKKKKKEKVKKKTIRNGLIAAAAAVVLAAAAVIAVMMILGNRIPEFVYPGSDVKTTERSPMVLYADRTCLQLGESGMVHVTVHAEESMKDSVEILVNGEPAALLDLEEGQYFGDIELDTSEPAVFSMKAVSGKVQSHDVKIYVQPAVTTAMVDNLKEAGKEMIDFVREKKYSDPYSPEALEEIAAYLEHCQRISHVERHDGFVFFITTDGLCGSFGLNADKKAMYWGGSGNEEVRDNDPIAVKGNVEENEEENYRAWVRGNDYPHSTLLTSRVPTNSKAMLLYFLNDDYAVSGMISLYREEMLHLSEGDPGMSVSVSGGEPALSFFSESSVGDLGFLMLATHGQTLDRSDGSKLAFFCVSNETSAVSADLFLQAEKNGDSEYENVRVLYDFSIPDEEGYTFSLYITTNYLAEKWANVQFDNTIVYLCCCEVLGDSVLTDLLLDHGAGAVFGSQYSLDCYLSMQILHSIVTSMGTRSQGDEYGTVSDVLSAKSLTAAYAFITEKNYLNRMIAKTGETRQDVFNGLNGTAGEPARPMTLYIRSDNQQRLLTGTKLQLNGMIKRANGNGAEGVQIQLYRWIDHRFQYEKEEQTGADGSYVFENVPYGYYAFHIKGGETSFWYLFNLDQKSSPSEDLYLTADLSGVVVNEYSQEPVANVTIYLSRLDSEEINGKEDFISDVTDASGWFHLLSIEPGFYKIRTECPDYNDCITPEFLISGDREEYLLDMIYINNLMDYYQYIAEEMVPVYGLSDTETKSISITSSQMQSSLGWDNREGIVAADIADYDGDEVDDLVVIRIEKKLFQDAGKVMPILVADFFTRDENGQVVRISTQDLGAPAIVDHHYDGIKRLQTENGYVLMYYSLCRYNGKMPYFTGGVSDRVYLYTFDGTSFDKHYFISSATYASALPYFISDLINGTSVDTAAFADALKEAGVLMRDDAEMEQGESADEYGDSVLQNSIPIAAYSHAYLSTQGRGALFESVLKDGTDLVSHLEKYLE